MRNIKRIFLRAYTELLKTFLSVLGNFLKPNNKKYLILFAGQYYNGGLESLCKELKNRQRFNKKPFEIYWVTKNKKNIKKFQGENVNAIWFYKIKNIPKFLRANIWINDHGSGDIPVRKKKNSLWVQVWHGIPFKGYAGNKKTKKGFNEFDLLPVSSQWLKDYYVKQTGVKEGKIVVTGEPREDRLLRPYYDKEKNIKKIGLNPAQPIILYAPTWEQDSKIKKPLFPFGDNIATLKRLAIFLEENKLQMIIRLHPNWNGWIPEMERVIKNSKQLAWCSVKTDWDTEKYLYISDVLVTDWSSIANDFIILNRPIIFLEIPIELFKHGFALQPEERAGIVVKSEDDFLRAILESIRNPKEYEGKRETVARKIHFKLDGYASRRVLEEMEKRMILYDK